MSKKIERMFRQRRLSEEEIAKDQEVRRLVQNEFPPATPSKRLSGRLSQGLRDALQGSGQSLDRIAEQSGISSALISRFLRGERDIHMATADKLAEALGLKLAKAS